MVAPLIAIGLRAIAPRLLSGIFGGAARVLGSPTGALTTGIIADQTLNDGRLASAAVRAVGDGISGVFRRAVGLDGPDGQLDWTRVAGMGLAATVGTMVLDKLLGTPLAIVASLALAYLFRDQIGGLAHSFARAVGLEDAPQTPAADTRSGLMIAPTGPAAEITNPSPEYQRTLDELSRLSRGLSPAPAP